jgi:hypothetical protein
VPTLMAVSHCSIEAPAHGNGNGGMQVVLNFIFVTGRLELGGRRNLAFNKAVGQSHIVSEGRCFNKSVKHDVDL